MAWRREPKALDQVLRRIKLRTGAALLAPLPAPFEASRQRWTVWWRVDRNQRFEQIRAIVGEQLGDVPAHRMAHQNHPSLQMLADKSDQFLQVNFQSIIRRVGPLAAAV